MNYLLDEVSRRIVGYLQLDGRAPFTEISEVLEIPERTVSRRGQELLDSGLIQISGLVERGAVARKESMIIKIKCTPSTNSIVASALSNLPESIFVYLLTGDNYCITEIFGETSNLTDIVLNRIPSIPGVQSIFVYSCVKYYKTVGQWNPGLLTPKEIKQTGIDSSPKQIKEIDLNREDLQILETLSRNGRATFEYISRTCGLSEATARRRTNALIASGAVSIHAVVNPSLLGLNTECWIWVACSPSDTSEIAQQIRDDERVRYLVTITGEYEIIFSVALRNGKELSSYLNDTFSKLKKIHRIETQLMVKAFKRSGCKVSD